ncbi:MULTISPECIES: fimbrial protein [Proteus]|uniref:Fimbrial protein n=2 Tax=Morganellaceae TaxID=1903414 RepID=A0ABS0W047_9GAMM|nr:MULTISPECIES: fimbrial protein [Proteus]EEG82898.1 fimbrial protein [Proteus penneri ATCC 35198]NBM04627.1 fimbrial protein [Proteus sp. G2671]NBN25010.1 fimbrial protein [Proteus sp. G2657]MBJ2116685.1 fimbrial protein [Proteus penneri]MCO8050839.1 fimbrial protein [Proteus penneri]
MNELFYSNKIMRSLLWILFLLIGCSIFLVQDAKAELANTNIVIKANIVANTCRVSPESMNKFVDLGVWGTKDFQQNKTTEPIKFTLNLTDCSVFTTGVKVTFKGDTDNQDNTLFKLSENDSAKNVGIAILDKNKDKVLPGESSVIYPVGTINNIALDFYAQYVSTGSSVVSGSANGEVLFSLEYL